MVSKELWSAGIRYRRNDKTLFEKLDLSIKKFKLVVFIDSCFWHGCPLHAKIPQSNMEFWLKKLGRNVERDKEVTVHYNDCTWNILRVWEHDLKEGFHGTLNLMIKFIEEIKANRL
jgi:DNA mismatch endonuclease (patch repair protein)